MKTLRVFKEGVKKISWIEAVAGFSRGWLLTQDIFYLFETGRLSVDEDDEVLLYEMKDGESNHFLAGLQKLVKKYDGIEVPLGDFEVRGSSSYTMPYQAIPLWAWDVWQLELGFTKEGYSWHEQNMDILFDENRDVFFVDFSFQEKEEQIQYWLDWKNSLIARVKARHPDLLL